MANRALDGIETLLIDGNNLLHRLAGSAEPGAQRTLIPRLRDVIPPTIATVLMLDGHADTGMHRTERAGKGFEIRHSGSISADDAIIRLVQQTAAHERSGVTVVSDDRRLRDRARHMNAQTQRLSWLEALIGIQAQASSGAAIGAGRRPTPRASDRRDDADVDDRPPWTPGRGATKKRGNPRRRGR